MAQPAEGGGAAQITELPEGWGRDEIDPVESEADRAALIAAVIAADGWQGLSHSQRILALDNLNTGGTSVDAFSVRWQGQLTAPRAGRYAFVRRGVPTLADDWIRVWIDGELVLDTSDPDFIPTEVVLPGEAVALLVEISRDAAGECWPVSSAILGWRLGDGAVQTVPASALQTPEGGAGLSAQYFSDPGFEAVFTERVDPSLDLVWDDEWDATAANSHADTRRALAASVLDMTVIESIFATESGRYTDSGGQHAGGYLGYAARNMTGAQREHLATMMLSRPDLLGQIDGYSLMELMWHLLPVSDLLHAELLEVWASRQPRYTTQVGAYPGWEHDGYIHLNWDPLAHIGQSLAGNLARNTMSPAALDYLLDEVGLARADGTANLHLVPVLTFACKGSSYRPRSDVQALIQTQLERNDLSGDARATWLVAQALFGENDTADTPHVGRALGPLEQALAAAESVEVRFWVLGEMVTRLISMGEGQWALSLLDSVEHQFPPERVSGGLGAEGHPVTYAEVFQGWRALAPVYAANAAQAREERRVQGDIGRVAAEVADLERIIAELQTQRQDDELRESVDALLPGVEQDLVDAQARLEALQAATGD